MDLFIYFLFLLTAVFACGIPKLKCHVFVVSHWETANCQVHANGRIIRSKVVTAKSEFINEYGMTLLSNNWIKVEQNVNKCCQKPIIQELDPLFLKQLSLP